MLLNPLRRCLREALLLLQELSHRSRCDWMLVLAPNAIWAFAALRRDAQGCCPVLSGRRQMPPCETQERRSATIALLLLSW